MPQPRLIPSSPTPYLSGFNGTGADIGKNLCIARDPATIDGIRLPQSADDLIIGVTDAVIVNGAFGDYIVAAGSTVPVLCSGGVAAGDRLMPTTTGAVATFAAGAGVNKAEVGQAKETAADGVVFEMQFTGPGVSRQG